MERLRQPRRHRSARPICLVASPVGASPSQRPRIATNSSRGGHGGRAACPSTTPLSLPIISLLDRNTGLTRM
jgi:hypothetical protein